jgi:hypothetical protein
LNTLKYEDLTRDFISKMSTAGKATPIPRAEAVTKAPLKIKAPDVFDGKRGELQNFLSQMKVYLLFNSTSIVTNTENVLVAGTYLRGKAYKWYSTYLQNHLKYRDSSTERKKGTKKIMDSYDGFEKALKQHFGNIDQERIAEKQIRALKQAKSASNYTAEFQVFAMKINWNDEALMAQYYQGLKKKVKNDIAKNERPKNLKIIIEKAIRIDNRLYEKRLEKKKISHMLNLVLEESVEVI